MQTTVSQTAKCVLAPQFRVCNVHCRSVCNAGVRLGRLAALRKLFASAWRCLQTHLAPEFSCKNKAGSWRTVTRSERRKHNGSVQTLLISEWKEIAIMIFFVDVTVRPVLLNRLSMPHFFFFIFFFMDVAVMLSVHTKSG